MNKKLKEKIKEALSSVIPITVIVLILSITIAPMPIGTLMLFLTGAVLLIVGVGFFSLGVDISMIPMGEAIGSEVVRIKNVFLAIMVFFFMGAFITIAEPDLQVLASQIPSIPNIVLVLTISVGVGIMLIFALLRILFKIKLSHILVFFYGIIFILTLFTPREFIPVAFESGAVTTGPVMVPVIMALGIGLASVRGDKDSQDDSFGLVAFCLIGPVIATMLLGLFYDTSSANLSTVAISDVNTTMDVAEQFAKELPKYAKDVSFALAPIIICFVVFQLITRKFRKRHLIRMGVGFVYTFIGLVLFLTGVNVGFMPAGQFILSGSDIIKTSYRWILIPIGMVIGYFIVVAEPSVHVLNRQVEEITNGVLSQKVMMRCLSIGISGSVGIAMLRVLTGISILWFLVPGYVLALALAFMVPKMFTGIAFDSGAVASGPMAATFLLPFVVGACESLGGNVLTDAFGTVALVALTPTITIQLLGLIYKQKTKVENLVEIDDNISTQDDIIDYESYEGAISNE